MNRVLIFTCAILFAVDGYAVSKLPLKQGELLSKARSRLIAKGWKPYRFFDKTAPQNEISLMAKDYIDTGYIEAGNCGADNPVCGFNYRKGKKCLRVIAGSYEAPPSETTVTDWTYECEQQWWK